MNLKNALKRQMWRFLIDKPPHRNVREWSSSGISLGKKSRIHTAGDVMNLFARGTRENSTSRRFTRFQKTATQPSCWS